MSNKNFTVNDGLAIQLSNLIQWKTVLNNQTFEALQEKCARENEKLSENNNGYDVFRGDNLTSFVISYGYSQLLKRV
jgi:hypothetical protein